jgi:hypothetical protein
VAGVLLPTGMGYWWGEVQVDAKRQAVMPPQQQQVQIQGASCQLPAAASAGPASACADLRGRVQELQGSARRAAAAPVAKLTTCSVPSGCSTRE